jgi:hypothetical protein
MGGMADQCDGWHSIVSWDGKVGWINKKMGGKVERWMTKKRDVLLIREKFS